MDISENIPYRPKYRPWGSIKIGESFVYSTNKKKLSAARVGCSNAAKRHKKVFRAMIHENVVRVWRVK